ncbi:AT-rich interactive domain-containing protein 1A isoform X1 [Ostrinia furnacalis]|uniref:AT-rich interactive domain-containing protein 1A isoform X1 n=1 Tax=Ostrinia furnacalis TaxID=93504 RepID=UPI00103E6009|nr:AT-rich interactive domain-containing protein 1A isoform X1 [Ostrinia furnacalis]XP_028175466.1 AT-rich interactive domain-containing protein 1A isoform X1 [Ostrinia furnacalis]XP_028175467.1 AT-rich interactive domain-containing protein 1A isoform X1 [Ostrinia furnacalis]
MATGPKIVHKQFNSPIGLYSQQNIQETLNKHISNLDNGSVGIDFNNPTTDKPANLANSAVLRMLEEEERNRRGYPKLDPTQVQAILDTLVHTNHRFDTVWPPQQDRLRSARSWDGQLNATGNVYPEFMRATKGQKKVVWPPVPETNGYHQQQQSPAYHNNAQHSPSAPQQQQPQAHYQPQPQYQPPQPQYQPPQPQYHQPQAYQQAQAPYQQQYQQPQSQPAHCESRRQEACGLSKLIPVGPGVQAPSPSSPYRQGPPSPGIAQPYRPASNRWAPVPAPLSPQTQGSQPSYGAQSQFSPQSQYSPQPQYSPQYEPAYQPPQRQFEPPPATITLRQQQPIHQKPPPVFASQPATASFQGGVNMRGDQKWPPQSVKEAVEAENEARRQLAKGPACRPRKVKKDYTTFFAQHALNNNYPGYRAPPGTQHYEDHSGRSSY